MIVTKNLTKKYANDFVAVDQLSVEIGEGEIFGYIGPNGAGKTTTIRILCGLLKPTSGKAYVAGNDVTSKIRAIHKVTGYLPDSFGVYEEMRVWEYLDFFGACFKIPKKTRRKRIDEVLDITNSRVMRDYFVDTLSHGMRQRIGIAKTLMHDPKVLFLDEPTNGLDPRARIEMRNLIRNLAKLGKTVLVSSHILPELATICDRVGIIERGRMLAQGTVEEIMREIRPNRRVEMHFRSDGATVLAAAKELEEQQHVNNVELLGEVLQFDIGGNDDDVALALCHFISREVEVVWFREQEADLEEAFMRVTDGAAAAGQRAMVD